MQAMRCVTDRLVIRTAPATCCATASCASSSCAAVAGCAATAWCSTTHPIRTVPMQGVQQITDRLVLVAAPSTAARRAPSGSAAPAAAASGCACRWGWIEAITDFRLARLCSGHFVWTADTGIEYLASVLLVITSRAIRTLSRGNLALKLSGAAIDARIRFVRLTWLTSVRTF